VKKSLFGSVWVCLAVFAGSVLNVNASNIIWNTSGTNDWNTAANWNPSNSVPGVGDDAVINNGGTAKISNADEEVNKVEIGWGAGTSGGVILDNKTLTLNDMFRMGFNGGSGDGGDGTYEQNGSNSKLEMNGKNVNIANNAPSVSSFTLNAGVITNILDIRCGEHGQGTLTINGGKLYSNRHANIGVQSDANGTLTMNGGTMTCSNEVYIGYFGTGSFDMNDGVLYCSGLHAGQESGGTGTITITGGTIDPLLHIYLGGTHTGVGTLNINGGLVKPNAIYIGNSTGNTGYCNLSNGTINCDQTIVGRYGTGYYTQTGGTNTTSWAFYVGEESGSTGTATLSGGLLDAHQPSGGNSPAIGRKTGSHGEMTVNGGELKLSSTSLAASTNSYGKLTINDGTVNITSGHFYLGNRGTGVCVQAGGSFTGMANLIIGNTSGSKGTYTISGGTFANNSGYSMRIGNTAGAEGELIVQGGDATILVTNQLYCTGGGTAKVTFMLDGNPATISPIKCNSAYLNSTNVTVEWKLGNDFHGAKDQEYTLIQTAAGTISTNGCNFVDSTGGHGDFELKLSTDSKRLYLTQNFKYPTEGTLVFLK